MKALRPVAVLSTTILPYDGLYAVVGTQTLGTLSEGCLVDVSTTLAPQSISLKNFFECHGAEVLGTFEGVPHYVGHPATRDLLEELHLDLNF